MERKLVFVIYFFVVQGCTSFKETQGFTQHTYNVLLQEKRGWPRYIFLAKDTAYYERRQFDKPSYFTDLDTLIRVNNCDCYQGSSARLTLNDKIISLKYIEGRELGRTLEFAVANDQEIKKWDRYKNIDKYYRYGHSVSKVLIRPHPSNTKYYDGMEHDWRRLYVLASELNQKGFDSALNNFKSKYSIR